MTKKLRERSFKMSNGVQIVLQGCFKILLAERKQPRTWSCHQFDEFFKTDHVTNNMKKSCNSYLNKEKLQLPPS